MPDTLRQVLDLARWAPSGDNTQPWRFEIRGDNHVIVHGFDTREHCLYDIDGRPSQIALGALVETLSIAASGSGLEAVVQRLPGPETHPTFDVILKPNEQLPASPLLPYIPVRAVQRRPMKTLRLSAAAKTELEAGAGVGYRVLWLEGWRQKLTAARLLFSSAKIRLTTPEAFEVHRNVIEWNARFSADKIPAEAVGLDPLTIRLMRWAMRDWRRIEFLNTYLAGTFLPRIQLDLLPALGCAAHFFILADDLPAGIDDYVSAGRAMQRFWLTATRLGLHVQPEMTPLIFSWYARERRQFSTRPQASARAERVRRDLQALVGNGVRLDAAVFMGRIGAGPPPVSRSTRLDLDRLLVR